MKLVSRTFWSWWLLLAVASCGDGHPAANGGNCDDSDACDCPNGRSGSAVCDVDTRAFVMCRCDMPAQHPDEDADAGSDRPGTGAAGNGGDHAQLGGKPAADGGKTPAADGGKTAAADGGKMAAADGGKMAAADGGSTATAGRGGDDQGDNGDGEAGKGAAGHPGKALGHTKGHGQDP